MENTNLNALYDTYKNCNTSAVFSTETCTNLLCNIKPNQKGAALALSFLTDPISVMKTEVKEVHMGVTSTIQDLSDVKAGTTPLIFKDVQAYSTTPLMTYRKHIDFNEDECMLLNDMLANNCADADARSMLATSEMYFKLLSESFWNTVAYQVWKGITTGTISYYTQTGSGYTSVNVYNTGAQISDVATGWNTLDGTQIETAISEIIGAQEDTGCCEFAYIAMNRNTFNALVAKLKDTGCCNTILSETATAGFKSVATIAGLRVVIVPSQFLVPDFANNDVNSFISEKILEDGDVLFFCEDMRVKFYDMLNVVPERRFDETCNFEKTTGPRTQCETSKVGGKNFALYYNYGLSFDKSASLLVHTNLLA